MASTFESIAVSPSGSTLLNALQFTTTAGTVLSEVIYQLGAGTLAYGQAVITSSAASLIVSARPTRVSLLLSLLNNGPNIYLGDSSVATSTGLLMLGIQGASAPMPTNAALYAIAAGAATSNAMSYMEFYL